VGSIERSRQALSQRFTHGVRLRLAAAMEFHNAVSVTEVLTNILRIAFVIYCSAYVRNQ